MPNHAHAIVRPLMSKTHPLEKIVGSWKQFSSKRINEQTGADGNLWQDESYDRIVRDEEHLYRCIQYIGRNPRNAGFKRDACPLWIRPDWVNLGWKFEIDNRIAT
jgi:putative transposase